MNAAEFPSQDEPQATGGRKVRRLVLLGAVLSLAAVFVARRRQ